MKRSREEFSEWMLKKFSWALNNHPSSHNEIYDYFNPPQSEDVKERARSVAREIVENWESKPQRIKEITGGVETELSLLDLERAFTAALLSFNPSVQMPSEEEIENEVLKFQERILRPFNGNIDKTMKRNLKLMSFGYENGYLHGFESASRIRMWEVYEQNIFY